MIQGFFLGFLILGGAYKSQRGESGAQKKTRLLNRVGLSFWGRLAG